MPRKATYNAFRFQVTGDGQFPFDMLRFDGCRPETGRDTGAMFHKGKRSVRLVGYARAGEPLKPTQERWQSFLWDVVDDSVEPIGG